MCAVHVGERARRGPRGTGARRAPRPCRASAGTRRPGRACSRSRSRARRGRAGGRRRSAARRSGWYRQTCDGAWPGVSMHLPGAEVGLDLDARGSRSRSGSTMRAMPTPGRCARLGVARAAAPRARRSARAISRRRCERRARGPRPRAVMCCVVRVHPQLAAGAVDDRRAPGRSGRSARACRRAAARARAEADLRRARARGARASPARACRCRRARCRRRRRSPTRCSAGRRATAAAAAAARRPAAPAPRGRRSRLRVGCGHCARDPRRYADVAAAPRPTGTTIAARATSAPSPRATSSAMAACWAPGGRRPPASARPTLVAPDGVRALLRRSCSPRCPTSRFEVVRRPSRGRPRARCAGGDRRRSPGPGRSRASSPPARSVELEGFDLLTVARRR